MTISETTLSETIFSMVPGNRFRMLLLMYNNASYRRFNVTGITNFTFTPVGATVPMTPATDAWTGSTSVTVEPEPGVDGRAFVVYKVTNPSAGVWHYEYAIHNQNLDRSIQSFSVPLGKGVNISNIGFHAELRIPVFVLLRCNAANGDYD